jgi:hypothetical protein
MRHSTLFLAGGLAAAVCAGILAWPQRGGAQEAKADAPRIVGEWTGTWGVYSPPGDGAQPQAGKAQQYPQMRLDCKVKALPNGKWEATFEGECGRPYKYTIPMVGRQAGNVALFQGTVDLGPMDGGVYDWIGRANEKEFVGFYTSQKYTGHFRLTRPKTQ